MSFSISGRVASERLHHPKEPGKQVIVLLRVVQALGKSVDVVDRGAEHREVGLDRGVLRQAGELLQALEHRGDRTVLVAQDAHGLAHGCAHRTSMGRRPHPLLMQVNR